MKTTKSNYARKPVTLKDVLKFLKATLYPTNNTDYLYDSHQDDWANGNADSDFGKGNYTITHEWRSGDSSAE
jgi:hypothetical protein